jgi:hypothetical protein
MLPLLIVDHDWPTLGLTNAAAVIYTDLKGPYINSVIEHSFLIFIVIWNSES